jgi:NAD(P)-dependent dehydrogenase (short-subunit alcohol dehydrogenase family)
MKAVLITGTENNFDKKLTELFVREGYRVFALGTTSMDSVTFLPADFYEAAEEIKKQTDKIDFLLDTTDMRDPRDCFTILDGIDCEIVERAFRQNVLRPMALLEAFLPLLDEGQDKRLFYLTSADASINETRRTDGYGYVMSKAALHQFLHLTRNKLAPKGYTFRVYDPMPGDVTPEEAAKGAYHYITRRRGTENHDPLRDDEENLVFRDALGRQHSW